jgi:large subunit ribosomal protein L3
VISGLIGKKLGMTQLSDQSGRVLAVTVIEVGPCAVTQLKTVPADGYEAVQVSYGRKKLSRATRAERGHGAKANVAPGMLLREFERRGEGELKLGQTLAAADVFKPGDLIDVCATSKGRGYAGVIKRHHFAGFPGSHGTHEYFRHGGAIGNRSFPGRIRKGLRMAGQMGNETTSVLNLTLVDILPEDNAIVISGSVPGPDGGIVIVKHAARARLEAVGANG